MNSIAVLAALSITLILSIAVLPSFAQPASQVYGCQHYGEGVTHCDLMLGDMKGTQVIGNSTLIHPLSSSETIFVPGKLGKAAELRAQYRESIEIMNDPELNRDQFSVAFWFKPTTNEPYSQIIAHSNKAQTAGWIFDVFTTNDENGVATSSLRFGVFNSNGSIFTGGEMPIGKPDGFIHVAGTFDGTTVHMYKDGVEYGSSKFAGNYTADPGVPVRIGSAAYCSSCNRWSGMIDDLQFYDRAIGQKEAADLFAKSQSPDGIISHWKFDGDTSDALGKHDGVSTTMLTSMAFAPDGRLFFSEKNTGEIRLMSPDFKLQDEPFARVDDVYASWEQGMLGITLDPDFEQNHYVYAYYTALVNTQRGDGGTVINRIVRFTDQNNKGTDMKVLLDNIPASRGFHSGGALAFGPDGKLYVTIGDATEHIFAQDPSIVIGKVLRINKDGSIPSDNPFPGFPTYTVGHRNMFGIAFDSDGTGMVDENGDFHYDELNVLIKGGNYGFPTMQPANLPPEKANNSAIKPLRSYWDAIAPTQMIYYDGNAIPELKGYFVFGSFTGDLYGVKLSENKTRIEVEKKVELGHFPFVPTIAVAKSPDGEIYYGSYQIYRLDSVSKETPNVFPVTVSAPDSVKISDLQVDSTGTKLVLDASVTGNGDSSEPVTLKVPKELLKNVTSVSLESNQSTQGSSLNFTVHELDSEFNQITVSMGKGQSGDVTINLTGTSVVPEFPGTAVTVAALGSLLAALALARVRKR